MLLMRRSSGARVREHENIAMRLPGASSSWRKGVLYYAGVHLWMPSCSPPSSIALPPKWQC
jgi:hypothetical protein